MRVTLSDIAKRVGVTPSTVQRALNDVEGVSDKKRQEIIKVAEEMGYKRNYIAATLKKGSPVIALVLPEYSGDNRYYSERLWEGARKFLKDYEEFGFRAIEKPYLRKSGKSSAVLGEVLEEYGDNLAGVLTLGNEQPEQVEVIDKYHKKGIPVVLVGTDNKHARRTCCVKTDDETAGRMAADLLINFSCAEKSFQIVITGDFSIEDQQINVQGFEKQLYENMAQMEIIKPAYCDNVSEVRESLIKIINSNPNLKAIYSTSSRNTVAMCEAIRETGRNDIITIGSDVFPESIKYIENGVLNAVIHKRHSSQAYEAMQVLSNIIVKGQIPTSETILCDSVIVMKSNVSQYKKP